MHTGQSERVKVRVKAQLRPLHASIATILGTNFDKAPLVRCRPATARYRSTAGATRPAGRRPRALDRANVCHMLPFHHLS